MAQLWAVFNHRAQRYLSDGYLWFKANLELEQYRSFFPEAADDLELKLVGNLDGSNIQEHEYYKNHKNTL